MIEKSGVSSVGAGIVGLSCALALAQAGIKVCLVDRALPEKSCTDVEENSFGNNYALRVSAINQAAINAYKQMGVWPLITAQRVSPYKGMDVWDKNNLGRVQFCAEDVGHEELGCIIENQAICYALWQKAETEPNITLIQDQVKHIESSQEQTLLMLESAKVIQSKLLVAADGANSFVRQMMNMPLTFNDYDQQAIVATIKTTEPHQQIARQVFTPKGPLAFLPLADPYLCSIVYSQQTEQAKALMALDESAFERNLSATLDGVLGCVSLQSERMAFPLMMRYSRENLKEGVILIGDAAHTIHPLAGQGANLGIMDALAVAESISAHPEINFLELKKTLRWRKSDAFDRIAAMEAFHRGFSSDFMPLKFLRGLALNTADLITPIKRRMIQEAMGTVGQLPKLAQG